MIETYTSLHLHSEYSSALLSFTDSIIRIPEALKWCYENGLYGMSLSDHEGCSGFVELEQSVEKMKLDRPFKHIFANEIYLLSEQEDALHESEDKRPTYWHFLLNALDKEGVHQLYELSSRAWLRSYMFRGLRRRPTFYSDIEEVIGLNQGHIVGSTACLGGYLPKLLLNEDYKKAKEFIAWGIKTFGENNFFLEVQPCYEDNEEQLIVNKKMWELHEELNIPIIVTTDAHYMTQADKEIHKAYLNSKDGGDTREADKFYATAHLFTPKELREVLHICFTDEQIDTLFQTTNDIADRVQSIKLQQTTQIPTLPSLPDFTIQHKYKDYYSEYEFLNHYANSKDKHEQYYFYQVERGLMEYEATHDIDLNKYLAQINIEMEQVKGLGEIFGGQRMSDYFTVVQKIVDLIWTEGDSYVGIGRGSAGCYLTNKLLGITGIDPMLEGLEDFYPWWRFCSMARSESIFDIDIDIQSFKKERILQAIKDYFGERQVCQIVTWGRLSSRTAIERACRGLGISNDTAAYLRSVVPVKRGAVYSLNDCLYGNEEKGRAKVSGFANELNKYPKLLETALAFEGLIISSGVHAGAVCVLKSDITDTGALMKSSNGAVISQFDLHQAEATGQLKFDLLSIDALEVLRSCMDILMEEGQIKWQGSLRETYNHYLSYDVLEKEDKAMWAKLPRMASAFQYDSRAGKEALRKIGATNLTELTLANGLMRLAVQDGEQPMDKYVRYRNNINEWYQDMTDYGIEEEEQQIFKRLLEKYNGVMISQEQMMLALMDKEVCGFTLKQADGSRKAVAKRNPKALATTEELLYQKGAECGRSKKFLDYLWTEQIEMSKSYAFALCHSHEYSTECLQELNLFHNFPEVYWNTAVITTQSQVADERDNSSNGIDYGKIAQSIYKAKSNGIEVKAPSINISNLSFTPNAKEEAIVFGLGAISGINIDIANQIIANRPYKSFTDFYNKNAYKGSLVTDSKFIQLIKAGCFDCFNPSRVKIMKQYIALSTDKKDGLTMANMGEILRLEVPIPQPLRSPYTFKSYVCSKPFLYGNHPNFKSKKLYWLDNRAMKYFQKNCVTSLQEGADYWEENDKTVVVDKALEKLFKPSFDNLKSYINTPEFLTEYNKRIMREKYMDKIGVEDENRWSFHACSYYSVEHEYAHVDTERYNITPFEELSEEPEFITQTWGKREWKQYVLSQILGTVIGRNDNHHMITLLDYHNNVINVKFDAEAYSFYKQQISEVDEEGKKTVMDKSWLSRGQGLIITGYRYGAEDFRVKNYSRSVFAHKVMKVDGISKDGELDIISYRYGYGD